MTIWGYFQWRKTAKMVKSLGFIRYIIIVTETRDHYVEKISSET